ncbi:MAG: leucyl aminopeptidase family protein [Rhodobacteraceae bacterium]|nr:leucyl aminopeptidase family protein [Paracoccaceae bacterium]
MSLTFAPDDAPSIPLVLIDSDSFDAWTEDQPAHVKSWVNAMGFTGKLGATLVIPDKAGSPGFAVFGMGTPAQRARGRFHLGAARAALPEGTYHIEGELGPDDMAEAALGWLLAGYRFDRYRGNSAPKAMLRPPVGVDAKRLEAIAAGEALTRDLINTPASDMGPGELEDAFQKLASEFGAESTVIRGEELLSKNFPMIHAVGRASTRAPRLLDMRWGTEGPTLTLVGKGVCFDTGGLDIKPAASMGLMKKDMGGAATVLGLARTIMALGLKLRLRVLVPAVENAISGSAFRPGDILTSRKGLTVEINNTDAEGRLVLADALALADEEKPDLIVSMATLTGAARVAVGPDLAPFFTTDAGVANALRAGAETARDPVWELPFHAPYEKMIEPGIADLDNAPSGGMAGAITAALFLRRFVEATPRYTHFDIYGWQPIAAPSRPKGGAGQGARALLDALPDLLGL